MADLTMRTGRTSLLGVGRQTGQGTPPASFAHILKAASFDITEDPQTNYFETLNGLLDAESAAIDGLFKVAGKVSAPFWSAMSMIWWALVAGGDTMTDVADIAFGAVHTGGSAAGDQTITLASPPPAVPAGVGEWNGLPMKIGGANPETLPILGVSGAVITTLPAKYAHVATDPVTVPSSHVMQQKAGANIDLLDFFGICGQYGRQEEQQMLDCLMAGASLKGDNKLLNQDFTVASNSPLPLATTSLTSLTTATGETNDKPLIQKHGGLISQYAAGGPFFMHSRITQMQWDLMYALQAEDLGGGVYLSQQNVVGKRTQKVTLQEYAGQNGYLPQIRHNFVGKDIDIPLYLWYIGLNGNGFSVYWPKCRVNNYDHVGPTDKPIGYSGEFHPQYDDTTGKAFKVMFWNSTTAAV